MPDNAVGYAKLKRLAENRYASGGFTSSPTILRDQPRLTAASPRAEIMDGNLPVTLSA